MPIFDNKHTDWLDHIWFDAAKWAGNTASMDCTFASYENEIDQFSATFGIVLTGQIDCEFFPYYDQEIFEARNLSPLTASLDCDFASYENEINQFTATYVHDTNGDITCTFESLVDQEPFTGTFTDFNVTGDIDCTFASYENETGLFAATFIGAGTDDILATGQDWLCRMQSGLHMDLSMRPWELEVEHGRRATMDNCIFKELQFEAYAMVDFVTLELETRRWRCEMGDAPEVDLTFEIFTFTGEAFPGFTATVDAAFRRFEVAMTAGEPYNLDCEAEELTFSATGDTPIRSTLNLEMQVVRASIEATTPWSAAMDLRGRQWRFDGSSDSALAPRGDLELTFRQLQANGTVDAGKVADIDSIFRDLLFRATANTDGINELDLTASEPDLEMGSGGAMSGETCAVADDLTFEEVL